MLNFYGSTDKTATVIKSYLSKVNDDRFKYLYKKNGGQSDARNYGIKFAKGKYIWFVDGDDYIVNDQLNILYSCAIQNNLDILVFNFKFGENWNNKYANKIGLPNVDSNKLMSGINIINEKVFNFSVWHMLYKTSFLRNNNLEFEKDSMAEDIMFNIQTFIKAQYTMFANIIGYCYCYRKNSITKTTNKEIKVRRLKDVLNTAIMIDKLLNKYHISEQSNLANGLVKSYLSSLIEGCATGYLIVPRKKVKQFMKGKKLNFKEKIKVFICKKILKY